MRLRQFRVENFRSVNRTDWMDIGQMTAFVGQNESGKSNLCEALWILNPNETATYNVDEDWPVDDWGNKNGKALVCEARFELDDVTEQAALLEAAGMLWNPPAVAVAADSAAENPKPPPVQPPNTYRLAELPLPWVLRVSKGYKNTRSFSLENWPTPSGPPMALDAAKVEPWAEKYLPKCVYVRDYEFASACVELNELAARKAKHGVAKLTENEQLMLIVLDLANVNIEHFLKRGETAEGRTIRSLDKRQASAYLSKQFSKLWVQKKVTFEIDIDGTTLNVFAQDDGVGMPVRLERRSTGFRWHVAFAWKFTHATQGDYKNAILILEEPGVHLHHAGHKDLLTVLDQLSESNTILYTTHLATMLDPAYPERVRIVEIEDHHTKVVRGVVSRQRIPMMVIEARLGLSASMSGLLGARQTLVVEGGDDALVLEKLSGLAVRSGKNGLSDRIYIWPGHGAPKTPMFAGFLVGHKLDSAVLLDSDAEGKLARDKIKQLYLDKLVGNSKFRVLMLKDAAKLSKNEPAIEDIFPDEFYLECVNAAYRIDIRPEDLPQDGSDQITKRVESILKKRGYKELDKGLVMGEMLKRFDSWKTLDDLPGTAATNALALIDKINAVFAESG